MNVLNLNVNPIHKLFEIFLLRCAQEKATCGPAVGSVFDMFLIQDYGEERLLSTYFLVLLIHH